MTSRSSTPTKRAVSSAVASRLETECPYVVAHERAGDVFLGLPNRRRVTFHADLKRAEASARRLSRRAGYGEVIDIRLSRLVTYFENGVRRALPL